MPPTKRPSLLERQNKLLSDSGFSSGQPPSRPSKPNSLHPRGPRPPASRRRHNSSFQERQDKALARNGQHNASSTSRRAEELVWENEEEEEGGKGGDDHDEGDDGTKSMGGRSMMSHAPSLHPSMAGSVVSMACSEVTIGAGDNTGYWDYLHRKTIKADLGHTCRECKLPFNALNEPITERRGARTSLRYHAECFSGFADPRSQASSSMHTGNLRGTQFEAAPRSKAGSKMRASKHFESGGNRRASGGSKIEAFTGGSNGFGDKSSKDNGGGMFPELLGAEVTGGLSLAQLEEHNKRMDREEGKEEEWKHNEGSHGRHGDSDSDSDSNDDMRST